MKLDADRISMTERYVSRERVFITTTDSDLHHNADSPRISAIDVEPMSLRILPWNDAAKTPISVHAESIVT
jgi:hypothetical protein